MPSAGRRVASSFLLAMRRCLVITGGMWAFVRTGSSVTNPDGLTGEFILFHRSIATHFVRIAGRSYHNGPFAFGSTMIHRFVPFASRVDHGRPLPVRGAATEPVAFPIGGLSRIYRAMWRPEISGPYLPMVADNAVPIIALPHGGAVRQRSIRRSADAHYGGSVRPDDAPQRSVGHDGHDAWCRCGRGWWVAVGAANSPPLRPPTTTSLPECMNATTRRA